MKKNKKRKFSEEVLYTFMRGLAVFGVFGLSLYTYAVTYPTQPNPVSGVVGMYVGKTADTYSGNLNAAASGYTSANTHCENEYDGGHICTAMEIINTYNHNAAAVSGLNDTVWLNNGPPAFTQDAPNDCNGWTNSTNSFFGTSWNFTLKFGTAGSCNLKQAFACCR